MRVIDEQSYLEFGHEMEELEGRIEDFWKSLHIIK